MNVVVNGLMTNYQKVGKGKAVVFLPGWGDNVTTFSNLVERVKQNYEFYCLDLPGFGGTYAPPAAWNLHEYSDFVKAWLKKLGLDPFAMVCHSYGGAVAMIDASGKTDIDKLILIASAGIRDKNRLRKSLMSGVAKIGKVTLYALPSSRSRKIKERIYKSIGSDLMLLPHMEQTYRRIINEDVRQIAAKIIIPTLLIYGSHDKL